MFEIKESTLLNEKIYETVLSNGLRLIVIPKKGFAKQVAIYATDYGSNDIKFVPLGKKRSVKVPLGIAHFLEHKMFDNPDGKNVFELFAKYGASPNAFTSNDMTAYYFVSTNNFYDNLHILVNFVNSPYFTPESVEKEKGIIGQEITMYDDMPQWIIQKNLLAALYKNHPIKNDIAGDIESISQITSDMLYTCYNNFYNPANMVLVTVGDIDPEKVRLNAEKFICEDTRNLATGRISKTAFEEPRGIVAPFTQTEADISRPMVMYGYKDGNTGYTGKELFKRKLTASIALDLFAGSESDFFNDMYDKQIIDNSFDYRYTAESDYAYAEFDAETEHYEEFVSELKSYINKAKQNGFSQEIFNLIKKSYTGDIVRIFNSVNNIAMQSTDLAFDGVTLFDYYDILNGITSEDVTVMFNSMFDEKYCAVSLVLPSHK